MIKKIIKNLKNKFSAFMKDLRLLKSMNKKCSMKLKTSCCIFDFLFFILKKLSTKIFKTFATIVVFIVMVEKKQNYLRLEKKYFVNMEMDKLWINLIQSAAKTVNGSSLSL